MTRKKIGLALSGGGARGFAHVGALKVLASHGIHFDMIAGTSAGSIVGGALASGMSADEIEKMARNVGWLNTLRPSFSLGGLLSSAPMGKMLQSVLPASRFEDLKIPFAAIAYDIDRGEQVFLKDTLTQKPKITQNVSDSGISTQFVLDMSNSNYTTNATAGLMTNTVTLVGANAGIQGNFDAAGTGTNFTTANAQALNVTGGRFIYNPGTGWSGSGSTATYNAGSYAYVDNGGVNLTTLDWNSFRDPADNLMNFGGSLVQRKRSGNICKNGSASGPSAAGITAGC